MNTIAKVSGILAGMMHKGIVCNPWKSATTKIAFDEGYWIMLGSTK